MPQPFSRRRPPASSASLFPFPPSPPGRAPRPPTASPPRFLVWRDAPSRRDGALRGRPGEPPFAPRSPSASCGAAPPPAVTALFPRAAFHSSVCSRSRATVPSPTSPTPARGARHRAGLWGQEDEILKRTALVALWRAQTLGRRVPGAESSARRSFTADSPPSRGWPRARRGGSPRGRREAPRCSWKASALPTTLLGAHAPGQHCPLLWPCPLWPGPPGEQVAGSRHTLQTDRLL